MKKMNKKGVEITLNFIVIAALVLIALIVAIIFFTGTSTVLFKKKGEITQEQLRQELTMASQLCNGYCTFKNQAAFDNPGFSEALRASGYTMCRNLPEFSAGYDELCAKSCKVAPGQTGSCSGLGRDECVRTPGCSWQ